MGFNTIDRSVKWEVNESLLQSYRGVFIASQSLFISAVGLTKDDPLLNLIIITIAIFQLIIGCLVIDARARVVDYYKFNLAKCNTLSIYENKLNTYVTNKEIRDLANQNIPYKKNWRRTRIRFDILIPASFMTIWISFLTNSICSTCFCMAVSCSYLMIWIILFELTVLRVYFRLSR